METEKINNLEDMRIQEDVDVDDDDDDGPPPGFQSIIAPQQAQLDKVEDDEEEDDDGPPPGFGPVDTNPPPEPPLASSDKERSSKLETPVDDDDDDGPPPGWEFNSVARALPNEPSNTTDIKVEKEEVNVDEDDDDGPPPGWETVLPNRMPPLSMSQVEPLSDILSDLKVESKQDVAKNTEEGPQTVSGPAVIPGPSSPPKPQLPPPLSSTLPGVRGKGEARNRIKRPTSGKQPALANQMLPPAPQQPAAAPISSSSELAQLVCGTCRKLCTYPLGAKWVQCPSCMEVNLAMQAHEIGQVKCKGCPILLMYPYGAPAVQCTSCRMITEIGAHNRRAPLAAQQNQRRRRPNRVR